MNDNNILGIDIGSISISLIEMTRTGTIVSKDYTFHEGHVREKMMTMLGRLDLSRISSLAVTSSSPRIFTSCETFDNRVSFIRAAKHVHGNVGALLIVGGEKFGLALFDENGDYRNYRSNTSCAAGTGSFLEQQAKRLNLPDIKTFCGIAAGNKGAVPKIASRCAVFAKTDLIHAQQEGYSLEEICDGLCEGLARNLVDTLFGNGTPREPVVMAGGVARNGAVRNHISKHTGIHIETDPDSHLFGAMGASLLLLDEINKGTFHHSNIAFTSPEELFTNSTKKKLYYYEPLELKLSQYPDFASLSSYQFKSEHFPMATDIEIDIYEGLAGKDLNVFLGIDIGSTSTKAVVLDSEGNVLVGLYTRTAGRPIEAVQTIFEALEKIADDQNCTFNYTAAGTTGSGRKFIGRIIGADSALDEITAHARAAYMIDPEVDTIIEIGGQDAKFTTLKNGMVTFSIMNNVCAAGTGSFIEEQAGKLDCPLSEYSKRAEGLSSPMSSDRCTVFMERDLNHYLSEDFSTGEVLASVLHSVRENYLTKVAIEKNIGEHIFFQGATAKNKALVAAFEQRLGKPITVSKFCHLTGALGVALALMDNRPEKSSFRGTGLYRHHIPVSTEVCELCSNSCKIKVAEVSGERVAFGFLCGRDYDTKKFVDQNTSGFDMMKERSRQLSLKTTSPVTKDITIGIPASLHLFEETDLWQDFFARLGIKTEVSSRYRDGVKKGKNISGAEFCAPMSDLHGHTAHLAGRCDYIFLPSFMEIKNDAPNIRREYCYYTQYAPAVINSCGSLTSSGKILSPVLRSLAGTFNVKVQLYTMLKSITGGISFLQVSSAYDSALKRFNETRDILAKTYMKKKSGDDINVLLLGRPYTVLSPAMNKGIPDMLAKLGVKVFSLDMIEPDQELTGPISGLLESMHWNYAARILELAEKAAATEGLYPVFVTSFKCTPDSYAVEYFKKIMDARDKPYLILQLDEHDSNVGYETRIEAGLRSFRNHFRITGKPACAKHSQVNCRIKRSSSVLREKTILLPRWDWIMGELMTAALRHEGVDARLVDESRESIQKSLSHNTGQCIPLSIMIQNTVDYVRKHNLDPSKTVMWNIDSTIACNLGMFPHFSKNMLESMGGGLEKIDVYAGNVTFKDLSIRTGIDMYLNFMFAGMLRKISCRIRPYENVPGTTDRVLKESVTILSSAIEQGRSRERALAQIIPMFEAIPVTRTERPLVAIFGDFYVRDNDVLNQNLISVIEKNGGEVITTPYSELVKIIADPYIRKWFREGNILEAVTSKLVTNALGLYDRRYYPWFNRILHEAASIPVPNPEEVLKKFNLGTDHTGESMENILKIYSLVQHYPDLKLFVQANPAFCCPSLVTEAMAEMIETVTGVPIVTIEYDGTGGFRNDDIIPYLKYPRNTVKNSPKNNNFSYAS